MKRKVDKDKIINTAISILDQEGLDNVTLKNVALHLNIASPSLYNHIKNLDELLLYVANHSLDHLYDSLVESIIGLDKKEALLALSNEYLAFFKAHPGQYSLIQKVGIWDKNNVSMEKSDKILELVEKILVKYNISADNAIHFIRTWRSFMHGFLLLETNHSFGLEQDTNDTFNYGLNLFFNNLQD